MGNEEYRESWAWVHLMLRLDAASQTRRLLSYLQDLRTTDNPGPLRPRLATAFVSLDELRSTRIWPSWSASCRAATPRNADLCRGAGVSPARIPTLPCRRDCHPTEGLAAFPDTKLGRGHC